VNTGGDPPAEPGAQGSVDDGEAIDFGPPAEGFTPLPRFGTEQFDPEPGRERVRALVAGALIALLALLSSVGLVAVIAGVDGKEIRPILEMVLPPVVALCGSAIGFYFGAGQST
jgi:hypothetical protein